MKRAWIGGLAAAAIAVAAVVVLQPQAESGGAPPTRAPVIADVYNPVTAGESVPEDFRQLLSRDSIRPIYDPRFVPAAESAWTETTIVIGVEVNGDARAYSVAHLGRREMVNDVIGGEPLLVTW